MKDKLMEEDLVLAYKIGLRNYFPAVYAMLCGVIISKTAWINMVKVKTSCVVTYATSMDMSLNYLENKSGQRPYHWSPLHAPSEWGSICDHCTN